MRISTVVGFGLLFAAFVTACPAATQADRGTRFDSANVLDLSDREKPSQLPREVSLVSLDAEQASGISTKPTMSEDEATLSFSDKVFGCQTESGACSKAGEAKIIANARVKRDGTNLIVTPNVGTPIRFVDWKMPETKSADGDGEKHWYLGTLAGNGYDRVEVQFEHDAPGDFLINPQSGKVAFVHSGSDVSALSSDGKWLLTFDALNEPLSIRVAALDSKGPRVALQCATKDTSTTAEFKGWNDAQSADLALVSRAPRSKLAHATAIRLRRDADAWQLATADPDRIAAIGFVCRQSND